MGARCRRFRKHGTSKWDEMGHPGGCATDPACVRDAVLEDPSAAKNHSGRVEITEDSGPMLWSRRV